MKFRFFSVSAHGADTGEAALNGFCAQHRIVSVDKHFVAQGTESYWALCVTYLDGTAPGGGASGGKRERVDYREVLNEQDFTVFAELRRLRKTMAEREGVPAYALFTNEQLAAMVTRRVDTPATLGEIDGIGTARIDKYGRAFLDLLSAQLKANPGGARAPDAD